MFPDNHTKNVNKRLQYKKKLRSSQRIKLKRMKSKTSAITIANILVI